MYCLMTFRIQGIQRRGDGNDCAPLPPKEREVRWACLAIFFLALGLDDYLHWERLEPAFGGNKRSVFPAGQSSRRGQCTGTGPLKLIARALACMNRHACFSHRPHHSLPLLLRKIAVHQNIASDLNTFTDTFPDNMRMKFVMTVTLLCTQHVEVW